MRYYWMLLFVISSLSLQAQFSCDKLEVLGIYFNNVNTHQLSIWMTNKSPVHDGNGQVYTSLQIVTDQGDTLLQKEPCACFRLPNSNADTTIYIIELSEDYRTIYELPKSFCGKLITQFPDCEIPICKTAPDKPDLPTQQEVNCADYKLIGLYPTNYWGGKNQSLLMTFTNKDFKGIGPTAYTTLEFQDEHGQPLSFDSGPHYTLPQYTVDTIVIHFEFFERLEGPFCGKLETVLPECLLDLCEQTNNVFQPEEHKEFEIYPNPISGMAFIKMDAPLEKVRVFDSSGKLVLETIERQWSMDFLPPGVYLVEVMSKEGWRASRFLVKQ